MIFPAVPESDAPVSIQLPSQHMECFIEWTGCFPGVSTQRLGSPSFFSVVLLPARAGTASAKIPAPWRTALQSSLLCLKALVRPFGVSVSNPSFFKTGKMNGWTFRKTLSLAWGVGGLAERVPGTGRKEHKLLCRKTR